MSNSYPNAFCVKCGTHTETESKHTVLLQNSARALRGVCPKCESDVYKILPKARRAPATAADKARYPDAYCVRCKAHTPTMNQQTVILDNKSRAMTGLCQCCNAEVYRIIGGAKPEAASTSGAVVKPAPGPPVQIAMAPRRILLNPPSQSLAKIPSQSKVPALTKVPALAAVKPVANVEKPIREGDDRRMAPPKPEQSPFAYFVAAGIIAGTILGFLVYSAW